MLAGKRSLMHHTQQENDTEEIIHSTELGPACWHTIRTLKRPGKSWTVVMNSLTVERPNSFTENRGYEGKWSFEERMAFGDIR